MIGSEQLDDVHRLQIVFEIQAQKYPKGDRRRQVMMRVAARFLEIRSDLEMLGETIDHPSPRRLEAVR